MSRGHRDRRQHQKAQDESPHAYFLYTLDYSSIEVMGILSLSHIG
jgi:hypothetical protein